MVSSNSWIVGSTKERMLLLSSAENAELPPRRVDVDLLDRFFFFFLRTGPSVVRGGVAPAAFDDDDDGGGDDDGDDDDGDDDDGDDDDDDETLRSSIKTMASMSS
jgi:hypothetical protein